MTKKFQNLLADTDVNTSRQYELDIAKDFAIIFMVWVHVYEYVLTDNMFGGIIIDDFLGGPFAAPVFMFCMGIGICYSRKNTWHDLLSRSGQLFTVGFVLNIFRYILPELIETKLYGDQYTLTYGITMQFSVDILQFASLAFLIIGLMRRFSLTMKQMMAAAILCSALGTLLRDVSTGNIITDVFAGYIWGTNMESYFPVLNWLIFPVAGYIFGCYLRRMNNRSSFYKYISPTASILGLSYLILAFIFGFGMFGPNGNYYYMSLLDACFVLLLVIGILGIDHLLFYSVKDGKKIFAPLLRLSGNINTIYCIHWILIGNASLIGIPMFWYEDVTPFWLMTFAAFIILLISDLLAWIWSYSSAANVI